jgi:hypothetical protein
MRNAPALALLALASMVLLSSVPAFAAPRHAATPTPLPAVCESFKAGVASIHKKDPDAKVVELTAAQRATATRFYNAAPPVSHDTFSHIYTISAEGTDKILVIFVQGKDCVKDAAAMTPSGFLNLLLGGGEDI